MPENLTNPYRGKGLAGLDLFPIADANAAVTLIARCPAYVPTPLIEMPDLAAKVGVARVSIKDERERMGLGSFKALGAAHAIARDAVSNSAAPSLDQALKGRVYVTASAGNHGLSVAAGARLFGAKAVIYLSQTVPEAFAERLRAMDAEVVRAGRNYEESMDAATIAAANNNWLLLSDSSWPDYFEPALRVMEGYLVMGHEIAGQIATPPTHILLQAGVGGLAAAIAAFARAHWGQDPHIIVVEPAAAPALIDSIRQGEIVTVAGPVSCMGRLDCKTPSMIALAGLARDADQFVTITEDEVHAGVTRLAALGIETTPSGGAGLAALLLGLDLGPQARVLAIVSEGPEDAT